ncbi:hypothetical protein BK671_14585 [Pseudomonas fluorescens]|uniref:Major facilitator superfamily (MFS) profile domain-containing protein n=1 Tax=Pseudomonas fluorescens TaxID=294 RepID=A0A423LFV6_PSEFL|nr:hypothetical protein BK671_14585 [Pseudomonas fluorescens]
MLGQNYLLPYFLGFAATQDSSGRLCAVVSGSYLLTGAIGPYFGGWLLDTVGAGSAGWLTLWINGLVLVILLIIGHRQTKRDAAYKTASQMKMTS